jgi:ectoine hydroxylase-related dioxygenase (phytanoyl-CoA dioxygenase family)
MKIELLYFDGCPSWENGLINLKAALREEALPASVEMVKVTDENLFPDGINPDNIDESTAVNVILNPGDISIHHPNIIHGSRANTSPRWRRGLHRAVPRR